MSREKYLSFAVNCFLDRLTRTGSEASDLVATGRVNAAQYIELRAAHKETLQAQKCLSKGNLDEAASYLETGQNIYRRMEPF
tara:strand:+ start:280 stop:525 length:246 start_codon:yes stop_codon:yes gene_type:complete